MNASASATTAITAPISKFSFAHRTAIRLCDRCAPFLTQDILTTTKPKIPAGK